MKNICTRLLLPKIKNTYKNKSSHEINLCFVTYRLYGRLRDG